MTGQEFGKARRLLQDVLSVKPVGPWHARADVAWKKLDRTERAIAGVTLGNVGKGLAVKDSLGRAQVAALLVDERKLDALFSDRVGARGRTEGTGFIPVDLVHHPFKEEVGTILRWNVRGLEPLYDRSRQAYLFKPEDPLTRKEFAVVLEDLLVKISRDAQQASVFVGHDHSPFPDVRSTAPWYNAIVTVVTRGLMETGASGEFYPDRPVDGTEVLLALRALRRWFG
ncbi:MAG: S-layer homology domain-containing protein [Candidatus Entotheonellia bacterium]